jgi:predicted aspartyl protease/tetratricopeptide (TPR) repeat protein
MIPAWLRWRPTLLAALLAAACPAAVLAKCELSKFPDLPVTMSGLRPMLHAKINGADELFIADSGAFFSSLTPAAAAALKLHLERSPYLPMVIGVGGETQASVTTVRAFELFNIALHDVEFLVAGNDLGGGAVGLLGQNVFRLGDVEYDLANGVIRIWRAKDCDKTSLAYWAKDGYNVIDIERPTSADPHTRGVALVNGVKVHVIFDTGAALSMLSSSAARRAGVTPDSPGVAPGGNWIGMGARAVRSWVAPFASFKIGDEEVRNTHLRFGADMPTTDMLVGADFFLSHRVFVASSQRKLYFTYNGGPVFNLTSAPAAPPPEPPAAGAGDTQAAPATAAPAAPAASGAADFSDQPTDAAGYARRGTAFAARRDFEHAIADLTRATELAPGEASYFVQLGEAHAGNHQPDLALADLDAALKLRPDDLHALTFRARLHLMRHEVPAAVTDLDAASRADAQVADAQLVVGDLYESAEQFTPAIAQYTLWISSHDRRDAHMPHALAARCRARAFAGIELDQALSDCNAAAREGVSVAVANRALVEMRRGSYDAAISDYDHVLGERPKDFWALYCRGVAKLRKGLTAAGQADIASATQADPTVAQRAAARGIAP